MKVLAVRRKADLGPPSSLSNLDVDGDGGEDLAYAVRCGTSERDPSSVARTVDVGVGEVVAELSCNWVTATVNSVCQSGLLSKPVTPGTWALTAAMSVSSSPEGDE